MCSSDSLPTPPALGSHNSATMETCDDDTEAGNGDTDEAMSTTSTSKGKGKNQAKGNVNGGDDGANIKEEDSDDDDDSSDEEDIIFPSTPAEVLRAKDKIEEQFGMCLDDDELDEFWKKVPKFRATLKTDILKKRFQDYQRKLALEHAIKVEVGTEVYNMNDDLREKHLDLDNPGEPFSMYVHDEELIEQFTASSYTVPFLLDIGTIMDQAYADENPTETTSAENGGVSHRNSSPVAGTSKSFQSKRSNHLRRTHHRVKAKHRAPSPPVSEDLSLLTQTENLDPNEPLESPTPTRFSEPVASAEDDEFTPKIGNSSQPSARVNSLSPRLAQKLRSLPANGSRIKLYTQSPHAPSLAEKTAAALKRFGTTLTPAPAPEIPTTNHSHQKTHEPKCQVTIRPKPPKPPSSKAKFKPSSGSKAKNIIHITPAMAASLTGLTRSKVSATSLSKLNGSLPIKSVRKIVNYNSRFHGVPLPDSKIVRYLVKKKDGSTKIIRKRVPVLNSASRSEDPLKSTSVTKELPISFLPQNQCASRPQQSRSCSQSPQLQSKTSSAPSSPMIINPASPPEDPDDDVPVITSVISQAQISPVGPGVLLLNPTGTAGATLTPISLTRVRPDANFTPDALRRYEELLYGNVPIRPKPPGGVPVRPVSKPGERPLLPKPAAVDPLAWTTPSNSSTSNSPPVPIPIGNGPIIVGASGSAAALSNFSTMTSTTVGQNILLNNNVLVIPASSFASTFSTNSTLTPIMSEAVYNTDVPNGPNPDLHADADATTLLNDNDNGNDNDSGTLDDENEILGL